MNNAKDETQRNGGEVMVARKSRTELETLVFHADFPWLDWQNWGILLLRLRFEMSKDVTSTYSFNTYRSAMALESSFRAP